MLMIDYVNKVYDSEGGLDLLSEGLTMFQKTDLLLTMSSAFDLFGPDLEKDVGKTMAIPYRDAFGEVQLRFFFTDSFLKHYFPVVTEAKEGQSAKERLCNIFCSLEELRELHQWMDTAPRFGPAAMDLLLVAYVTPSPTISDVEIVKAFLYRFAEIPLRREEGLRVITLEDMLRSELELDQALHDAYAYMYKMLNLDYSYEAEQMLIRMLTVGYDPLVVRSSFSAKRKKFLKEVTPKINDDVKVIECHLLNVNSDKLFRFLTGGVVMIQNFTPLSLTDQGEKNLEYLVLAEDTQVVLFTEPDEEILNFSREELGTYFENYGEIDLDVNEGGCHGEAV